MSPCHVTMSTCHVKSPEYLYHTTHPTHLTPPPHLCTPHTIPHTYAHHTHTHAHTHMYTHHTLTHTQVKCRDEQLSLLHKEHHTLQDQYNSCCRQLEMEEKCQTSLKESYASVLAELERSRGVVLQMEGEEAAERERCAHTIAELQCQLRASRHQVGRGRRRE